MCKNEVRLHALVGHPFLEYTNPFFLSQSTRVNDLEKLNFFELSCMAPCHPAFFLVCDPTDEIRFFYLSVFLPIMTTWNRDILGLSGDSV
jgi:hypothetical protein